MIGEATCLAVAAALRANSSLRILNLHDTQKVDQTRVGATFIEALWLNTVRPAKSVWQLHSFGQDDYSRLKEAAEQLGHPSLQLLLLTHDLSSDSTKLAFSSCILL